MLRMSEKRAKILVISGLTVGIMFFHYGTPHRLMYIHLLLQSLFFIPVSLAGWWFGKRGGLFAAAAIAVGYIHHAITVMMPTGELAISNGIQILLLFIVGSLTGIYADIRNSYHEAILEAGRLPALTFSSDQKLLVCLDEPNTAITAVQYVANILGSQSDAMVTLLGLSHYPNPELFKSFDKHKHEHTKALESMQALAGEARTLLLEGGFTEDRIETRFADLQETRISDAILEEQQSGGHSAIVIGRRNLSRAEEFLFGNPAVRLARQAPCPVWVIGEDFNHPASASKE